MNRWVLSPKRSYDLSVNYKETQMKNHRRSFMLLSVAGAATLALNKSVQAQAMLAETCLLYTSPSPRDATLSRMPSSA